MHTLTAAYNVATSYQAAGSLDLALVAGYGTSPFREGLGLVLDAPRSEQRHRTSLARGWMGCVLPWGRNGATASGLRGLAGRHARARSTNTSRAAKKSSSAAPSSTSYGPSTSSDP